jgi:hypothetical protein
MTHETEIIAASALSGAIIGAILMAMMDIAKR